MAQIDIDFDVFKALTALRESEEATINHVLRRLLKLPERAAPLTVAAQSGCNFKGVFFPEGTQFRATYKGRSYTGEIKNGQWVDGEGKAQSSPSSAAYQITGSGVNGWWFWEAKRPTDGGWTAIGKLREAKSAA